VTSIVKSSEIPPNNTTLPRSLATIVTTSPFCCRSMSGSRGSLLQPQTFTLNSIRVLTAPAPPRWTVTRPSLVVT
jgi:hypothetical protein